MKPQPRFRILGPLEVDGAAEIGGPKQRAVLARLLLGRGVVTTEQLVEDVWQGARSDSAARSVQVYVSELRRALGGDVQIRAEAGGYRLELGADELDARRFEQLLGEGRRLLSAGQPDGASAALGDALLLWRGAALADFAYADWAQGEIARLEELRLEAIEERIEAELALGLHDVVVAELEALVTEQPYRERLRRQLMLALYRAGRQADALSAYRETRSALSEELGLEPSSELRELEAAILRQEASLLVEPAELRARRHLPAPATPLVGRQREVRELAALLRDGTRLVTLTGPGGTGKTRLAIQAAHDVADRFADGVFFVGLSALRDPELVPIQIATALGVEDADPQTALAAYLQSRVQLLVLDNFEQVDAAAPGLTLLLSGAPGLKLVVTSRQPLRLYGEHEYAVAPLALDEEAVPLFLQRAAATGTTLAESAELREICTRLDCLPLAIELAAARARDLSPKEMLATLPRRLELASGGPRDAPARQRTLEAAIAWSYELLDKRLRQLLERLAVLAGTWDANAARAVAGAEAGDLEELRRRNLLTVSAGRFSMLETIREFAAARLDARGPTDELRALHASYFLALAEEGDRELAKGGDSAMWLDRLEREHDNFRAALDRAPVGGQTIELRLATALGRFWEWRGHVAEGRNRLERSLDRESGADASLKLRALLRTGVFAHMQGDLTGATARMEQALALARETGDGTMAANALRNLGTIAKDEGEHARAGKLHAEARVLSESLGDRAGVSSSLINLADIALATGSYAEAETFARESVELARELGHEVREVMSLLNLAPAVLLLERGREAAAVYRDALDLCDELVYGEGAAFCFLGLASLLAERDELQLAGRLLAAAEAQLAAAGAVLESTERPLHERALQLVREGLDDETFEAAWADGADLSLADAIEESRSAADVVRRHDS